jgi:outer membrane receptor protein involved in Fe transport
MTAARGPTFLLLAVLVVTPCSRAQAQPEDPDYTTVVTGKRGQEPLFSADRSISVVTSRQVAEEMPRTTPEALTEGDVTSSFQHFFERKDAYTMAADLVTRLGGTRDEVTARTLGQDLQLITRLVQNRLRLRYGGMYYRDWVQASRERWKPGRPWEVAPDKAYPDGSTYDNYGVFLHVEGDPLRRDDHLLRIGGGYRLHGMVGQAPAAGDLPEVDFSDLGHVFLASAQYLYGDVANLAFTFSQGFRAPNLQEAVMLGDTGKFFHVPNPDLNPERADTFELLARARLWKMRLGLAGYVTLLHDLIKRVPSTWNGQQEVDGKDVFHNVNGGQGLLWGTEVQADFDLGWGLSLGGHLTYTWGEEQKQDGTTEPLTRIPPLFGMVRLRWDTPAFRSWRGFAEAFVRAAGDQTRLSAEDEKDVRIPAGGTPGWWTLNLRLGLVAFSHVRVGVALENLLNQKYRYHGSGLWAPGINAIIRVAWTL